MGSTRYNCGELVGGFSGSVVESGGLDIFQLLSSSSIWLYLVYATMIMILRMNTTCSLGEGRWGGECKGGC